MTPDNDPIIQAGPLRGGGTLVRDYLAGVDLSAFYTGHPADPSAYERKAAEVEGRLDAPARARVAPAVRALGDAAERLQRILGGDGFFVTTGQQPALFGGPLYTVHKILSAIRLADGLEQKLQRPVLALFWVGSDDHDWDEANHATFLDDRGYVERIGVTAPVDAPQLPLSDRVWGPGIGAAVDRLIALLPNAGFGRDVANHVRGAYLPDATVAESFAATLMYLLADRRLAVVDAAHPALRRAAVPVLRRELEHADSHASAIVRQTKRLIDAGYHAQVDVDANASNIMLIDGSGRDRLVRSRGGWRTRRGQQVMTEDALTERLEVEPTCFSPNVLLRPVVESALFPTIAYVAGPGELSYFAQIGCLFREHGILPPIVVPRGSVTIVEPKIDRILAVLALEPPFFERPYADVTRDVLHSELPLEVRSALAGVRDGLHATYAQLGDAASSIDPTLRGPVIAARNAALIRAAETEKKIVTQLGRRNDVLLERLRRVSAALYPNSAPQERVLNILHYLARYGPGLIGRIEAQIEMTLDADAGWSGPSCG